MKTLQFLDKEVPELIFGSLTMAPMQRNMPPEEGGRVIASALKKGLRWIDTAQLYGSYPHVCLGIEKSGINREKLVISTKSACQSYEEMNLAIEEAKREMQLTYIDLFLLHAVRSVEDYEERSGALQALIDAKERGGIGAVGISSHSTIAANALAEDERLDWYHLMFNKRGMGLTDGTLKEQTKVIKKIKKRGARFYAMKPLGGGYLRTQAEESLIWVKNHPLVDAVALGMISEEELEMNIKVFSGESVSSELSEKLANIDKELFVFKALCIGCRECEKTCEQSAIQVVDRKAIIDSDRCILCAYCVPTCPKFALRII